MGLFKIHWAYWTFCILSVTAQGVKKFGTRPSVQDITFVTLSLFAIVPRVSHYFRGSSMSSTMAFISSFNFSHLAYSYVVFPLQFFCSSLLSSTFPQLALPHHSFLPEFFLRFALPNFRHAHLQNTFFTLFHLHHFCIAPRSCTVTVYELPLLNPVDQHTVLCWC